MLAVPHAVMFSFRLFVLPFVFALLSDVINAEVTSSISMVGRTGDGKSSFCNLLSKHFNYHEHNPFGEGRSVNSHTTAPKTIVIDGTFQMTDNPGLMDANGINQDEQNIVNIVTHAKSIGNQKGFILVINSEAPRFDGGMRSAVKLLFDSFGPQFLSHLGILFTREKSDNITSSKEKVDEYKSIISQMTGHEIGHFPFWLVDNHPEDMASFHVPEAHIEAIRERNKRTIEQIKAWSTQLKHIDMSVVEASIYDATRKIKDSENKIAELKKESAEQSHRAQIADENYKRLQTESTKKEAELERMKTERLNQRIKEQQSSWSFWSKVVETGAYILLMRLTYNI
jgi:hypothetical protein